MEDVGLVVGKVVARVVVVGLRVSCSSGAAVAEGGCLGWDGLRWLDVGFNVSLFCSTGPS